MKKLLFPTAGRITRKQFWMAALCSFVVSCATGVVLKLLALVIPNESTEAGSFAVNGIGAIPFVVIGVGVPLLLFVSAIMVGIKRFHDRDKSGAWLLVILVPLVGQVWYIIETGFLPGTPGPNRFGPSALPGSATLPGGSFSAAR